MRPAAPGAPTFAVRTLTTRAEAHAVVDGWTRCGLALGSLTRMSAVEALGFGVLPCRGCWPINPARPVSVVRRPFPVSPTYSGAGLPIEEIH